MNISIGNLVEKLADAVGLPEQVGDFLGGTVDLLQGNVPGALFHALDLFCDIDPAEALADFADRSPAHHDAANLVLDFVKEETNSAILAAIRI